MYLTRFQIPVVHLDMISRVKGMPLTAPAKNKLYGRIKQFMDLPKNAKPERVLLAFETLLIDQGFYTLEEINERHKRFGLPPVKIKSVH